MSISGSNSHRARHFDATMAPSHELNDLDDRGKASRMEERRGTPRSSRQEGTGLTELEVPQPVDSDEDHRRRGRRSFLEDAVSLSRDEDDQPSDPTTRSLRLTQHTVSPSLTKIYTISYLIFFSIMGTLARLGIQWLTFYPGAPVVTPVLWANVGGSFVMGFLTQDRRLFQEEWGSSSTRRQRDRNSNDHQDERTDDIAAMKAHVKVKKTIPLYIGLATGFCGSFTSFSTFERDVFLALSNDLTTPVNHPYSSPSAPSFTSTVPRNGGYSFMALLALILLTLSLSLAALEIGAQAAAALSPVLPVFPFKPTRRIVDPLFVLLSAGIWLTAIFLSIFPPDDSDSVSWRGKATLALVFAPVGCLTRWYVSAHLNGLLSSSSSSSWRSSLAAIPLGTFACNIFGCLVEGLCFDLQRVRLPGLSSSVSSSAVSGSTAHGTASSPDSAAVACQVLQGVMDGFCGCLTTVSTFVSELRGMRRRHAWVYGLGSVGCGMGVMVVVMGSVRWSIGWREPVCVTMRTSVS